MYILKKNIVTLLIFNSYFFLKTKMVRKQEASSIYVLLPYWKYLVLSLVIFYQLSIFHNFILHNFVKYLVFKICNFYFVIFFIKSGVIRIYILFLNFHKRQYQFKKYKISMCIWIQRDLWNSFPYFSNKPDFYINKIEKYRCTSHENRIIPNLLKFGTGVNCF